MESVEPRDCCGGEVMERGCWWRGKWMGGVKCGEEMKEKGYNVCRGVKVRRGGCGDVGRVECDA